MATKEEIIHFMATQFPQNKTTVETIGPLSAVIRYHVTGDDLRPGGTVSARY